MPGIFSEICLADAKGDKSGCGKDQKKRDENSDEGDEIGGDERKREIRVMS